MAPSMRTRVSGPWAIWPVVCARKILNPLCLPKKKKFKTCSMNGSDFAAATERKKKEKGSNLSNCSSPRKKKVLRLRILVVSELCWVYKRLVVRDVRNFLWVKRYRSLFFFFCINLGIVRVVEPTEQETSYPYNKHWIDIVLSHYHHSLTVLSQTNG